MVKMVQIVFEVCVFKPVCAALQTASGVPTVSCWLSLSLV